MCNNLIIAIEKEGNYQEAIKTVSSNLGLKTKGLKIYISELEMEDEKAKYNAVRDILRDYDCSISSVYQEKENKC